MKLSVPDAAALLGTAEDRVFDWIESGSLPAERIRGRYRINRTDLLEWATARGISVAPAAFAASSDREGEPSMADALRAGGVHRDVGGSDVASVLRNVIALLALDDEADRDALLSFVLARGSLGITPVGDGLAIPHVRRPLVLSPEGPVLALVFLARPVDLDAPDGRPVDTLFFLISPTVPVHLAMLARLASSLKNPVFRGALRARASAEEILRALEAESGARG